MSEESTKEAVKESPNEIHKKTGRQSSPWMYTTIVLAFVCLGLLFVNMQTTGYIINNANTAKVTGNAVAQGNQAQPTQPAQAAPSGTAPSAEDDAVKGDANAPVTIIEFSDFQCPYCSRFWSQTQPEIQKNYIDTGKVKLVFRDFPLSFHPNAEPAAEAAECAGEQGKYYEFHDKLFANQADLSRDSYIKWAGELSLNVATFTTCIDTNKYKTEVQKDFADGQAAGVTGTPTFFINGQKLVGAQPFDSFKAVIDPLLAK